LRLTPVINRNSRIASANPRAPDITFREGSAFYKALFRAENEDIGLENAYFWNVTAE
jgi:hypothetical protein